MLKFNASAFVDVFGSLHSLESMIRTAPEALPFQYPVDPVFAEGETFLRIVESCKTLELDLSHDHAARIISSIESGKMTFQEMAIAISELRARITDELRRQLYFRVPTTTAKYYDLKAAFGPEVAAAFPGATIDIEEQETASR